jgi:hypothetical protein
MHRPCAHLDSVQSLLTILIIASGVWFVAVLVYFEAALPCQVQPLVHSLVDVVPTNRIMRAEVESLSKAIALGSS